MSDEEYLTIPWFLRRDPKEREELRMKSQSELSEPKVNSTDLLPCPFCGSEKVTFLDCKDTVLDGIELARLCSVECRTCGAEGPKKGCQGHNYELIDSLPKLAIDDWNHRAR